MKPILFGTEMVRAILDGRKTMTRQVIKTCSWPSMLRADGTVFSGIVNSDGYYKAGFAQFRNGGHGILADPPCRPGDILWARETWGDYALDEPESNAVYFMYRADYPGGAKTYEWPEPDEFGEKIVCDLPKWRPSIHMPREAARLFLRVKAVRVERLQEITEEDAASEGVSWLDESCYANNGWHPTFTDPDSGGQPVLRDGFHALWDSLNAKRGYGWDTNPFVWVIEFERISREEAHHE